VRTRYTCAVSETKRRRSWPGSRFLAGRQILDDAYGRADAMIESGQRRTFRLLWFFLPETSDVPVLAPDSYGESERALATGAESGDDDEHQTA